MMTEEDIAKTLDLLVSAYGEKAFPELSDKKKLEKINDLWAVMFVDDDPAEVLIAVKDCIATLKFKPTIADIKTRMAQNKMAGQMTEMEAWAVIREAVERSNSRAEAEEIYNSLPKILQRVVGSPSQLRGWRVVPDEQFETVIASNVQRTYRLLAEHQSSYHALTADVQKQEQWKVDGPQNVGLPEPEKPKRLAYEKPEWMIRREELGLAEDE